MPKTHLQETADIGVRVDDVSNTVDQLDVPLSHGISWCSLVNVMALLLSSPFLSTAPIFPFFSSHPLYYF